MVSSLFWETPYLKQLRQKKGNPLKVFYVSCIVCLQSLWFSTLWFSTPGASSQRQTCCWLCGPLGDKNNFRAEGLQFPTWREEMHCEGALWFFTDEELQKTTARLPLSVHKPWPLSIFWGFHALKKIFNSTFERGTAIFISFRNPSLSTIQYTTALFRPLARWDVGEYVICFSNVCFRVRVPGTLNQKLEWKKPFWWEVKRLQG